MSRREPERTISGVAQTMRPKEDPHTRDCKDVTLQEATESTEDREKREQVDRGEVG